MVSIILIICIGSIRIKVIGPDRLKMMSKHI